MSPWHPVVSLTTLPMLGQKHSPSWCLSDFPFIEDLSVQVAFASTEAAIRGHTWSHSACGKLSRTSFQSQAHILDMLYMLELHVLWTVNKEQSRRGKAGGKVDRNNHTHLTTVRRKAAVWILGETCKTSWARVINGACIVKEIWSYELQFIFEGRLGIHWKKVKEILTVF